MKLCRRYWHVIVLVVSCSNSSHPFWLLFQALKELYVHLTPIQRVNIARHPNRPTFLDHVFSITDKVWWLHALYLSDIKYFIFSLTLSLTFGVWMVNVFCIFPYVQFVELHGDRAGYDDPAVVTGIGTIDGRRYMFMGHQKGRNTKENIQRNFGMPTPHG